MDKQHLNRLRKNWVKLVEETPFIQISNYMYQEGIFSKTSIEDIFWQRPSERPWLFLDTLQRSGPRAYSIFLQGLKNCGKEDLANLLEDGDSI